MIAKSLKLDFITFMMLSLATWDGAFAAVRCTQEFNVMETSESRLTALSLYGRDFSGRGEEMRQLEIFGKLIVGNPAFKKFYRKYQKENPFAGEKGQILALEAYQNSLLESFENTKQLNRWRDRVLEEQMEIRGAPAETGLTGRKRFEAVSETNLKRIRRERKLNNHYRQFPEIVKFIQERFPLNASRNSGRKDILGRGILSSRQLENLIGTGGLNSDHPLNRDLLKTDDNIYFFLDVVDADRIRQRAPRTVSVYGKHGLMLNLEKANETAWISPFIMNPQDIRTVVDRLMPELNRKFKPDEQYLTFDGNPFETDFLRRLHRFDFTVKDFKLLVEDILGNFLMPGDEEVAQFAKVGKTSFKSWPEKEKIRLRNQLLHFNLFRLEEDLPGVLGLPPLELKIPVYLPKELIGHQW